MIDPAMVNELAVAVTGAASIGVMWLARIFISWVNQQSGIKKMGLMLLMPVILGWAGKGLGVAIPNLQGLTDPTVANSVAASLVAMGGWAVVKEIQKALGKYNLSQVKK